MSCPCCCWRSGNDIRSRTRLDDLEDCHHGVQLIRSGSLDVELWDLPVSGVVVRANRRTLQEAVEKQANVCSTVEAIFL